MALELSPAEYNKFSPSLKFVLQWEGGYVNDPNDPGGETKWGISKRYHPNEDIKNLTPDRCSEIYYNEYWIPSRCQALDYPLCLAVFDTAVNLGVNRALDFLGKTKGDAPEYIALRKDYYRLLVRNDPRKQRYLSGWLNRCQDLEKVADLHDNQQ